MRRRSGPLRVPLARLLIYYVAASAVVIGATIWLVLRLVDDAATPEPGLAAIVAAVAVALLGLVLVATLAPLITSRLDRLTEQALGAGESEHPPAVPRFPIGELDRLAQAVAGLHEINRTRAMEAEAAIDIMEKVLDALPQGTIIVSSDDTVLYANPHAHELLGGVPETLAALAPLPFQTAVRECRARQAPVTSTADHGKPVRRLLAIATPLVDDNRTLLVVDDVTGQERAAAVRRDFVANASHELKTPLSAIIASADALRMAVDGDNPNAARFAGIIQRSARQLDQLVTDLLDLSRLERDQPELAPLRLDLVVGEEAEQYRAMAEEKGVALDVTAAPVQVAGNSRDLGTAVRNLLDNAVRHTSRGGSIRLSVTETVTEAVIRVRDTGEGIPTRDLNRIFERFYRVDPARSRATGGTGLGLAIVKHVVESHGGRVKVESELGVGSTFTVHLPLLAETSPGSQEATREV